MLRRPRQPCEPNIARNAGLRIAMIRRDSGQRFGKLVPVRLGDAVLGPRCAQLVRLVEHHQVIGCPRRDCEVP